MKRHVGVPQGISFGHGLQAAKGYEIRGLEAAPTNGSPGPVLMGAVVAMLEFTSLM